MTRVGIVVPTVGRAGLHDLLKRLREQVPAKGVEVIVVDDARRKGLPPLVATSVLIPLLAVAHRLRGWWRHRNTSRLPRVHDRNVSV